MWLEALEQPGFPANVFGEASVPTDLEAKWAAVPEKLDSLAFVAQYVEPLLFDGLSVQMRNRLHGLINRGYFSSYAEEFEAGLVIDLVYLASRHSLRSGSINLQFNRFREELRARGLIATVANATPLDLLRLREDELVREALVVTVLTGSEDSRSLTGTLFTTSGAPLEALLKRILETRSGKAGADRFHKSIAVLLADLFEYSLTDQRIEAPIDQGRKRIDITFRNIARVGFFDLMAYRGASPLVIIECKNYTDDPAVPEIDQLAGRFSDARGTFGVLVCRRIRRRELLEARCRDVAAARPGACILPIDDSDLVELVEAGKDPRWSAEQSGYLYRIYGRCTAPRVAGS